MFSNSNWIKVRGRRALLATLLIGIAIGAGGAAWSSVEMASAPLASPVSSREIDGFDRFANVGFPAD